MAPSRPRRRHQDREKHRRRILQQKRTRPQLAGRLHESLRLAPRARYRSRYRRERSVTGRALKRLLSATPLEPRSSRLLVAYLALGLVAGIISQPIRAIVNYLFLAGYAAIIAWWLRNDARLPDESVELPTRSMRLRDVVVVVLVAGLARTAVTLFWFGHGPRELLFGPGSTARLGSRCRARASTGPELASPRPLRLSPSAAWPVS